MRCMTYEEDAERPKRALPRGASRVRYHAGRGNEDGPKSVRSTEL